jgi:colanic acid/amylovoran biosynthesis protein
MLEAIVERLGDRFSLSAPPVLLDYSVRSHLGMYQTLHVHRFPRLSASLGNRVMAEIRHRYGLVADADISGVLDASGFAYSDSFGPKVIRREAYYGDRWFKRGVPKVMLPQAYGPFRDVEVARWTTRVLNQASIVFVRDSTSEQHLRQLSLRVPVEVAPDFTIALTPMPASVPVTAPYVAIVPNTKLVTRKVMDEKVYVDHLVKLGRAAMSHGLAPLVIIHEKSDRLLASQIATLLSAPTFENSSPRVLKGAIGAAELLIASRFHAIVGGLSQMVPTVAIGWSHKYVALLQDFDVADWVFSPDDEPSQTIDQVLNEDGGVSRLRDAKSALVERAEAMWQTTEQIMAIGHNHQRSKESIR